MPSGGVSGGFLPPAAVDELRALSRAGMTATATVQRPTTTAGPGGAQTTTWADVPALSNLPCSLAPAGEPTEAVSADAIRAALRMVVKFDPAAFPEPGADPTAAITGAHRLVVAHTIPGEPSPLVLRVLGWMPRSVYEVTRRVLAERVQPVGV